MKSSAPPNRASVLGRFGNGASVLLLFTVFGLYLAEWLDVNWPMLTDVLLQTDDARTSLFPFHRYGKEKALEDDPIASEMMGFVPPAVRVVYALLVPFTGVFLAAKVVQGMALGLILLAAVIVARSRRAGLGAAVLLLFLLLHDWFVVNRIAGGLPRSFGFSAFALWAAGILAAKRSVRFSGPVLAALTYPSVMNVLLAAEGLYALRRLWRVAPGVVLRRLRRYGMLVFVCFACVLPAMVGGEDRGPIHTLEEAEREPAFGRSGRLWILPFAEPLPAFSHALVDAYVPRGDSPVESLRKSFEKHGKLAAGLLLGLFMLLPLTRRAPIPVPALALGVGAVAVYTLSRVLAFRLYSPERYYSFGMRMFAAALILFCVARAFPRLAARRRELVRSLLVVVSMGLIWVLSGSGQFAKNGMEIDARRDAPLYEFVRTLPKDVRFAGHLLDTDGIPLYSARATTGGFETLQPWFKTSWQKQKERTKDTLTALYATDEQAVLDYAAKYGVTHFLLNRARYGSGLTRNARSFQPFSNFAKKLLRNVEPDDVVLGHVPKAAVLFKYGRFSVVSVKKLEEAWSSSN